MPLTSRLWDLTGGRLLVRAGVAGQLTTVGRRSGAPRTVQCGYLRRPDGSLLVGSADGRHWPANLAAAGWCTFGAKDLPERRYRATLIHGEERSRAVAEFRRARGDRAAAMFSGPVFVLTPDDAP